MKEIKIKSISTKNVENLLVYNLELESNTPKGSNEDDLCYIDYESSCLTHNCLRKDFGMINEHFPQTDLLLQAYKINEFFPKMCVDQSKEFIKNNTVGILGYTFKKDTDDTRDTLVLKLISYINRNTPKELSISDYHLTSGNYVDEMNLNFTFDNISTEELIRKNDIIYIGTNHSKYYDLDKSLFIGKIVIDPWRILNSNLVNDYRNVPIEATIEEMDKNLIEIK